MPDRESVIEALHRQEARSKSVAAAAIIHLMLGIINKDTRLTHIQVETILIAVEEAACCLETATTYTGRTATSVAVELAVLVTNLETNRLFHELLKTRKD